MNRKTFASILYQNFNDFVAEGGIRVRNGKIEARPEDVYRLFRVLLVGILQYLFWIYQSLGFKEGFPADKRWSVERAMRVTITNFAQFRIDFSKPHPSRKMASLLHGRAEHVPHLRMRVSRRLQEYIVERLCGVKMKELRSSGKSPSVVVSDSLLDELKKA